MASGERQRSELNELGEMRDAVFFAGPERQRKVSRYWILLILSSVISAAGIVADSTATVIGAMIVAPLMLPIQGVMLASVLGDRLNLRRALVLLVGGSIVAVGIGFLLGLVMIYDIDSTNNAQVAARASPGLVDLLAALATGAVGSIALVRRDISDTLPGVAIAISLVPPLSVVGVTLESGAWNDAFGSLVLFLTNVSAMIGTGMFVMSIYGRSRVGENRRVDAVRSGSRRSTIIVLSTMGAAILVILSLSGIVKLQDNLLASQVQHELQQWAHPAGWVVTSVTWHNDTLVAQVEGPSPAPDTDDLQQAFDDAGIDTTHVSVRLVEGTSVDFDD